MHIGFIEDTHLHGGTQLWVAEAVRVFIQKDQQITLLAPEGSWIVDQCRPTGANLATYDWDEVVHERPEHQEIWTDALKECDVAVCTVHPPREGFHCSVFAGRCIREAGLATHLIPKTGTIVPEYLREFYLPDETIHVSVIAIADFTRKYLIERYGIPEEAVALIYQGTDVERFTHSEAAWREAKDRYILPEEASPILGSIGSFEHRKGHPILFEALRALVDERLPHVHLMMVGDGPDETKLRAMVKSLGLGDHVTFFPFTDEPNYVFERIDLTVLPSLEKEGLPNVLLESMSMGVPVVSSNLGGIPEIVIEEETGGMVAPGDAAALANAIETIWADQDNYRKMKSKVRDRMLNRFDKSTQFERFLAHFESLVHAV
ncbi:MAG TPA: glycosyltransferase family 4 protein [Anaerolineae bacterium]|nr:glycosyltransferase family 4 protein [Anaerolineae bacterium]